MLTKLQVGERFGSRTTVFKCKSKLRRTFWLTNNRFQVKIHVPHDLSHVDSIELAAEILQDGPSDDTDLFLPTLDGHYEPMPFALECGWLWIKLRGRRFSYYKKRKDAGTTRELRRVTRKSVRSSQTVALDRLADTAKPSGRLAGISTDDLRRMRRRLEAKPLKPTKEMKDFTKTTEQRAAEKNKVKSWRGFGAMPALRKKQRQSDILAPPQEQPIYQDPVLLIAVNIGVHRGKRDVYKRFTGRALSAAAGFEVDSIRAVYVGSASTSKCLVWLEVLARGLMVRELAGTKKRQFSPAYQQVKAAVHFSTQFAQTQRTLVDRFTHFAHKPKSQWKRSAVADQKKAHVVKTLEDFRVFLLAIQRVPENSMAFSARCRPPRRI